MMADAREDTASKPQSSRAFATKTESNLGKEFLVASRTRTALSWLEASASGCEPLDAWEDGTCQWLFRHDAWKSWEDADNIPILWIHGIPGKYRSFCSSHFSRVT